MFLSDLEEIELDNQYILRRPVADYEDAETLLRVYSDPEVSKYIPDDLIPKDIESGIGIIDYYRNAVYKNNMAYWSIARKDNNKMIGLIGFCDINYYNHRAEIAYELDPQYWRQGITSMAVNKIAKIMFEDFNIKRIQANVLKDNFKSISLLEKAGFINEGILYSYRVFKGKQVDIIMLGLPSDKYFNNIIQLKNNPIFHIKSHKELIENSLLFKKKVAN